MAAGYCAVADVERYTQVGSYGVSTIPTTAQVQEFIDTRAGEIYHALFAVGGTQTPGPIGSDLLVDLTTDHGRALAALLEQTNALGAAADALECAGAGDTPNRTERVAELFEMYYASLETAKSNLAASLSPTTLAGRASNHYDEGRVTRSPFTSKPEAGLTFDSDTRF